jgi:hypothetical protein
MPALAQGVGSAEGPAFEGLQGRKPRSAGEALVMLGAAMGIAGRAGTRAAGSWAVAVAASASGRRSERSRRGPDGVRGLGYDATDAWRRRWAQQGRRRGRGPTAV